MSLFIGFKTEDSLILASDAKFCEDVPYMRNIYYEYFQTLASFPDEKLWMTGTGFLLSGMLIFEKLKEKKVSCIEDIKNIDESFFKEIHAKTLAKDHVAEADKYGLGNCLSLLFGGIDNDDKPLLCSINSYDDYKKKWITKDYEYVTNKIDFGESDKYLDSKISEIIQQFKSDKTLLKSPKRIVKEIDKKTARLRNRYKGMGKISFYVEISKSKVIYKEFRKIKRFLDGIKHNMHYLLFVKLLKVH